MTSSISSNKYEALCCWSVDDDDQEDQEQSSGVNSVNDSRGNDGASESNSSHEIEFRTLDEMREVEEADNLVSYEDQVQLELKELQDVHEAFYVNDERESNAETKNHMCLTYQLYVESWNLTKKF